MKKRKVSPIAHNYANVDCKITHGFLSANHLTAFDVVSRLQHFHFPVTGTFRPPDWVTCRACDDSYHLACLDPPLESRPNKWRCLHCKERNIKVKEEKEEKEQKPLFEGEHDDDCFMCFNGGGMSFE